MAFCTNCGKPLKPGMKFCTNCGTKVPVAMATTPPPPPPPVTAPPPPPPPVQQVIPPPPPAAPRPSPQPSPIMGRETTRMALPIHGGDVRQDREGPPPPPVAPSSGVKTVAKAASSVTSMARSFDIMASNKKGEWVASTWQPTLPASSTSLMTKVKNFFIPQRKLAYAWFLLPVLTTVFTIVSYVVHVVGRLFS